MALLGGRPPRTRFPAPAAERLHLNLLGLRIDLHCDAPSARLVRGNYSACIAEPPTSPAPLLYAIALDGAGFHLQRVQSGTAEDWAGLGAGELLFLLEKTLTIEMQKRRPHLYFLHGAALRYGDRALLLIGRSGNGKSTSCWGLLHHGCDYLSDELAPVDLRDGSVRPYPHALCLKSEPARPYGVPAEALRTGPTLHIPVERLPAPVVRTPVPVDAIFHVRHVGTGRDTAIRPLSTAEAGALIYANALNPLAHAQDGLDGALTLARRCRSFELKTGSLATGVAAVLGAMSGERTS